MQGGMITNMYYSFLILVSVSFLSSQSDTTYLSRRQQCIRREQHGFFRLAGLFSIHADQMFPCVNRLSTTGVFQAEAMVFAIEEINSRSDLLQGVTLGYEIWDDGWSESMVMATTLSLLNGLECAGADGFQTNEDLIGIVGASRSATTILITRLARIFDTPIISYYATSDELSNKDQFPYFLRTVPPDIFQVQAIVDIILHFGWDYIAVVHSIDSYGIQGAQQIYAKTIADEICVAFFVPISVSPNNEELDDLIEKLHHHDKLKVIVIFAANQVAFAVFKHLKSSDLPRDITWLASDGISADLIDHDFRTVAGGLFMDFYSQEVSEFEDYIRQQDPSSDTLSPWLSEYCGCQFGNCTDSDISVKQCLSNLPEGFSASHVIVPVIDAVYTYAIALDNYLKSNCPSESVCVIDDVDSDTLLDYLRNVSYIGQSGHVRFDDNGDPLGKYVIKNLQFVDGTYEFVQIGVWNSHNSSSRWTIEENSIQFPDGSNKIPTATCKAQCPPRSYSVPLEMKCCWGCQICSPNEIIVNSTFCKACPRAHWPNDNYTACEFIHPSHLDWRSPLLISIITLDLVAIILCGLTLIGMWIYRKHIIIKATSRELSAVNLLGLFLALLTPFPYLSVPDTVSCTAGELCLMIAFCLIFAPTTLKVNRIYRIFDAGKKSVRAPGFVSPRYQMILVAVIVTPQVWIYG